MTIEGVLELKDLFNELTTFFLVFLAVVTVNTLHTQSQTVSARTILALGC